MRSLVRVGVLMCCADVLTESASHTLRGNLMANEKVAESSRVQPSPRRGKS